MYDKQIHANVYLDLQHMYLRNDAHGHCSYIHDQTQKYTNIPKHENTEMPRNE